jgi:hypothetical protein
MSEENALPVPVKCYLGVFAQSGEDRTYLVLYSPFTNDVLYLELDMIDFAYR